MKRILKLKKIKKSKKDKRSKKFRKKISIWRKHFFQIDSPHNTNEYLINVNSSPFSNDDEDSIEIIPSINTNLNNDFESDFYSDRDFEVTKEKTINEKDISLQLIEKKGT